MINDINITPMVDIMLVLLIIFMVTASIIVTPSIPVKLPSAATGEETKSKTISIVITKENKFFIEGKSVDETNLEKYLNEKKVEAENDVEGKKNLQIVLAADEKAFHGNVMAVIDTLRKIGITDYAFSVEDKK
jgi:biopolymer transport protein ExbD